MLESKKINLYLKIFVAVLIFINVYSWVNYFQDQQSYNDNASSVIDNISKKSDLDMFADEMLAPLEVDSLLNQSDNSSFTIENNEIFTLPFNLVEKKIDYAEFVKKHTTNEEKDIDSPGWLKRIRASRAADKSRDIGKIFFTSPGKAPENIPWIFTGIIEKNGVIYAIIENDYLDSIVYIKKAGEFFGDYKVLAVTKYLVDLQHIKADFTFQLKRRKPKYKYKLER